jgi:uncharacterized SAM-binding protein YcdF (DUF218 family)
VLALCLVLGAGAWIARAPLLRGAAELWIVSDAAGPADAVAILGGGLDVRPFAAAEYFRRGLAPKIVLANVRIGPAEKLGVLPPHTELNRIALRMLKVPETAIESFGIDVTSTREEALALRAWADRTGARAVIVPTEMFSTRRVRWMLGRAFEGSGVRVMVPAQLDPDYSVADWWRNEHGLIAFQNEVIKYFYYRFKY